ncbi:AAA family ATPase [Chromatiaceae bacterium AAb-1]|nr:AAA family ATPase [Chromatiaceae bacterium AAb-1]
MYRQHFHLHCLPFGLTPDTAFYVDLPQHQAALNVLKTALLTGEGFIKVTGEVGTGKTLLCRKLLQEADADWQIAWLPDPYLTPLELRWALAAELGMKYSGNIDSPQLLQLLQRQLVALAAQGKRAILIIDEAQALPDETLEALRLLTNLETEQRKLLQVVLLGQPELNKRLATYRFRQLRQRISFSYPLTAMNRQQVNAYLAARGYIAGSAVALFSLPATVAIARYSRGIPRLVNILAHKGLMLAFGEGKTQVSWRHIRHAAFDTDDVSIRPLRYYLLGGSITLLALTCYGAALL